MNLIYGEILDLSSGPGPRLGKIRVGGAMKLVPVDLLTDPAPGDRVLICEGVALAKVVPSAPKENAYVSGHPR